MHKLSWGLPNEIMGIAAGYGAIEIMGAKTRLEGHVQVIDTGKGGGAFTLGSKVIGDSPDVPHEQGHYFQNLVLGPAYVAVIAIPSVVHYWYWQATGANPSTYHDFYTEAWADAWK